MPPYMIDEGYKKAVDKELARRKSPEFLRRYPALNTIRQQIPEKYFSRFEEEPGVYGYTRGTRYSGAQGGPLSVHLLEDMPPEEFEDTLRHEYGHAVIDKQKSQNWPYIFSLLNPTERLSEILRGRYPRMMRVEEAMLRQLGLPNLASNKPIQESRWTLDPTQRTLLPDLDRFLKYGENVGSIWGPEYPGEYQGTKGIPIVPRFEFKPSPTDRSKTALQGVLSALLARVR